MFSCFRQFKLSDGSKGVRTSFSSNLTFQRMLNEDYNYFGFDHIMYGVIAMHESNGMREVVLAILIFSPI